MRTPAASLPTLFLLLLVGALPPAVVAQNFGPPVQSERLLVLLNREGSPRFILSAYDAHWENPFRVTLMKASPVGQVVSQNARLVGVTAASPLVEGSYFFHRGWSLGFWYNPIQDQTPEKFYLVHFVPFRVSIRREAELADVHVDRQLLRGLSAQVGYYYERGTLHLTDRAGSTTMVSHAYRAESWNVWLTQRLDVFWRNRLVVPRLFSQVVPFVSVGYDTAASLDHATSVLTGVAVTYRDRLSLSASVWLFDLRHPATRITGGLVVRL